MKSYVYKLTFKNGKISTSFKTEPVPENINLNENNLDEFIQLYSSYLMNNVSMNKENATKETALKAMHQVNIITSFVNKNKSDDFTITKLEVIV
jgi:hypothetical protein